MASDVIFVNNSRHCTFWPEREHRCTVIYVLAKVTAATSIIGCVFVMMTIIILKKYKFFVQQMIFSLAFSACLESIGYISNRDVIDQSETCRFLGFFCQYFGWATMLWVFLITLNMLLTVKKYSSSKFLIWFHVFVWSISLLISSIPFTGDTYGPAGIWCWIKRENSGMRFGAWYIPLLVIGITMLLMYFYIIGSVLRETRPISAVPTPGEEWENIRYRKELRPLLPYPLIYILFSIPGLMYRIDDAAHPKEPPNYALVILSVIFLQSIGLCNSLSFIILNTTRKEISWQIIKQRVIALFSANPHVVHENYQVDDIPVSNLGDVGFQPAPETHSEGKGISEMIGLPDASDGRITFYT